MRRYRNFSMENLIEKTLHRRPRPAVSIGVIRNIRDVMRIGRWIGKCVVGPSENHHLPIHVTLTHLFFKSLDLAGWHKCVVSAGAYQNLTPDIRGIARAGGIQTPVE
jgi:hypothetical protein